MSARHAPDTLGVIPSRFSGIRRVTRSPLAVVFAVALVVLGAFAYTVNARSQQAAHAAAASSGTAQAVDPEIEFSAAQDAGLIPMATPEQIADPLRDETQPPDPSSPLPESLPPSVEQSAQITSEERTAQLQQQADQARAQLALAAVSASTTAPGVQGAQQQAASTPFADTPPSPDDALGDDPRSRIERLVASMGSAAGAAPTSPRSDHAAFVSPATTAAYSSQTRTAALASLELKAGSVIPGIMVSGINSDLPGQITAQVRENVRDSRTGRTVLIPQGAKLIGVYDSDVASGQRRILVAWTRVIFPDGSSLDLERAPGADAGGYAGLPAKVDNRTWAVFRDALLLSAFAAGAQISQGDQQSATGSLSTSQIAAAAVGAQLSQTGAALIGRNANIQPTLSVQPGMMFNVAVTRDFVLPAFSQQFALRGK